MNKLIGRFWPCVDDERVKKFKNLNDGMKQLHCQLPLGLKTVVLGRYHHFKLCSLPSRNPLGQIAGVAQTAETTIDIVMVAPHHLLQRAFGYARFDVLTVKTQVSLDIETECSASDRALGIDQTGAVCPVQHRANDGT